MIKCDKCNKEAQVVSRRIINRDTVVIAYYCINNSCEMLHNGKIMHKELMGIE